MTPDFIGTYTAATLAQVEADRARAVSEDIRESLAALAHAQWSDWMRYLLAKCERDDGSFAIPYDYYSALKRQINTPYADLTESEKEQDRAEADKTISLLLSAAMHEQWIHAIAHRLQVRGGKP